MKTHFILFGIIAILSSGAYGAGTDITTCTNKQQSCGTNKYCTKYGYCYPECGAPLTLEYGWESYSKAGVEQRKEWCLVNGADESSTSYRCIAGYYGSDQDCTICPAGYYCPKGTAYPIQCPSAKFDTTVTGGGAATFPGGETYGPTSKTGATAIEDCYIPANHYYRYKDATGVYTFDEDCHYGCDCYITE